MFFTFLCLSASQRCPGPHKQMQITLKTLHNVTWTHFRTAAEWLLRGGLINLSIEAMGPLGIFSLLSLAERKEKDQAPLFVQREVRLIPLFMLTLHSFIPHE